MKSISIFSMYVLVALLFFPQTGLTQSGQIPDLRISIEGPRTLYLYRSADYKIIVTNNGNGPAKTMELVETLPSNLDYISSKPQGVYKPSSGDTLASVSWQFQEIPPQGKSEFELKTSAKALGRSRTSVKLISGTIDGPKIPPLEAILEIEIRGIPAMSISSYDTEDPVKVGEKTIYVVEARNEGTGPCTGVRMTNNIPEEMELVKCEGPGVSCKFEKGQVLFDMVPFLAPGAKLTYKIHCRAIKPGSAKNRAVLNYDQFTTLIINEEGTSVY